MNARATVIGAGALVALFGAGGCETIYGIGDLPRGDGGAGDDAQAQEGGGGACTEVPVDALPAHGDVACPGAARCSPKDETGFHPIWVPPVAREGACTDAQISGYFDACIDTATAAAAACTAWQTANRGCLGCIMTPPNAIEFGAAVTVGNAGSFVVNFPGCIARAEPCNETCARAIMALILCEYDACDANPDGNCPVTDSASLTAQQTCVNKSSTTGSCACAAFVPPAQCVESLDRAGPAFISCGFNQTTPLEQFRAVTRFMCGPL